MEFFTNKEDWLCISDAGDFVCGIDENGIFALRRKTLEKCTAKDIIELGNKMNELARFAENDDD